MNGTSFYKSISIIGLIVITALQLFWTVSTYQLMSHYYIDSINRLFIQSINKDVYKQYREQYPRAEAVIISFPKKDATMGTKGQDSPLGDVLYEYGFGFNLRLKQLDSIFTASLKEAGLYTPYKLTLINNKNGHTINTIHPELNSIFTLSSQCISIYPQKSIAIQATMISPYKNIFGKMTLLLAATVIMFLLVMYCIVYQIRIIIRQKKNAAVREDFSYAMVHDMKTPLSSILMGTHVLRSGSLDNKPDKRERYFSIIEEETQRLLSLINKILTISKLEDEKIALQKNWVDLEKLIFPICENFKLKANKEVVFSFQLKAKMVNADEEYLKEVIENMIDNAIKYSKPESVRINISSDNDEEKCSTLIHIKDDGIGISSDDQHTIFEKFERGSAVNRAKKGGITGFGLGLNYVYQVMQAHGGHVKVKSEKDKYSEFILSFPV